MLNDIYLGFKTFFNAIKFVRRYKLAYFYVFPLILSCLMYYFFYESKEVINDWILELVKPHFGLSDSINGWFQKIISWTLTVTIFFFWIKINRYIVLILLSPMLSILSEKTEKKLTGKDYPFSLKQLIIDIWRGSIIAIKNICIELSMMIICWIITFFFPPTSIVTVPFLIILAWYYMGFSFLDYNYERRKLTIWEGSKEVWNRKGIAIVHGGLFLILCYIPILGVIVGSVWCTVASALAVNAPELNVNQK